MGLPSSRSQTMAPAFSSAAMAGAIVFRDRPARAITRATEIGAIGLKGGSSTRIDK